MRFLEIPDQWTFNDLIKQIQRLGYDFALNQSTTISRVQSLAS